MVEGGMSEHIYSGDWDDQDPNCNHNEMLAGEIELWRNAQWRVTSHGLEAKADPSLLGPPYWLSVEALRNPHVAEHVCRKTWVHRDLFLEAYGNACELHCVTPPGTIA